jgi:hypothetical protein
MPGAMIEDGPFVLTGIQPDNAFETVQAPTTIARSGHLEEFDFPELGAEIVRPTQISQMAPANAAEAIREMAESAPDKAITALVALLKNVSDQDEMSEHFVNTAMHAGSVVIDSMREHGIAVNERVQDALVDSVQRINERLPLGLAGLPLVNEFITQLGLSPAQLTEDHLDAALTTKSE